MITLVKIIFFKNVAEIIGIFLDAASNDLLFVGKRWRCTNHSGIKLCICLLKSMTWSMRSLHFISAMEFSQKVTLMWFCFFFISSLPCKSVQITYFEQGVLGLGCMYICPLTSILIHRTTLPFHYNHFTTWKKVGLNACGIKVEILYMYKFSSWLIDKYHKWNDFTI